MVGAAHEYRHLQGWRDIRNAETIRMYVAGKGITVAQAIDHGAKPKDHLAALKAGGVKAEDLIAAGVDLQSLQRAEERQIRSLQRQIAKAQEIQVKAKSEAPKTMAVIAGRTVLTGQARQPTAHELQVAIAVQISENAARDKAKRDAKGIKGFEVKLTAEEQQALMATLTPKAMVIK